MRLTSMVWAALACATAGCGGELSTLQLRLLYAQDSCGDTPVNNAFFEAAGTVGVHVLDSVRDNGILAGACVELEQRAFRALNDLPAILESQLDLEPLPLSGVVRIQVDVFDASAPCEPFRDGVSATIPKYSGASAEVFLADDPETIDLTLSCL